MGGLTLLAEARAAGLRVTACGDRVRVSGPRRLAALARQVLAHKQEVLAALGKSPTPSWPPRDSRLAEWLIERRQRWGERANALEDAGLDWREAEQQAFQELLAEPP